MAQHIFTGTTAPSFTPTAIGQHYIDTTAKISYISIGTSSSADWETSDAADVAADLATHVGDTANPHSVTKTQVGLGNVDDTSDLDKPVSTAQSTAIGLKKTDSMDTNKLLGRGSAGTGVIEEITLGTGLSLAGTTLNAAAAASADAQEGDSSYFFTSVASDLGGGRLEMIKGIPAGGGFGIANTSVVNGDILASFASVSGFPNVTYLPSGILSLRVQALQIAGTKTSQLYAEFYSRTILGVDTLLGTSELTEVLTGSSTLVTAHTPVGVTTGLLTTDRLVIVIKASVTGAGTDPDITINIQGATHSACRFPFEPVSSVNGQVGAVVLSKSDIGLGNVDNTSDVDKPVSNATQTALNAKQDTISVGSNAILGTNASGVIQTIPDWYVNTNSGGLDQNLTIEPDNASSYTISNISAYFEPLQNSPNEQWSVNGTYVNLDNASGGFTHGTNGNAVTLLNQNVTHQGTGDTGSVAMINNSFNIGNGSDSIDVRGISYLNGFGQVNANVNISGPIQGYGFQPNVSASGSMSSSGYINAFYDTSNIGVDIPNYQAFNSSPILSGILNNNNFTGMNLSPTITTFNGNAGFMGLNVNPTLGTFNNNGYFHGININPTITSARYTAGLNVTMDNVTPFAGVESTVTIQDLTYEFISPGDNNSYTIEYTTGATAGSEVVSIIGTAITIQIDSGVSTATQVKTAADASPMGSVIITTISGTAGNAQTTVSATNFTGGENPGSVRAAYFDGDVEITGGLTFGGALSIGKLNAYASQSMADGFGIPASIHSLITNPTVGDSVTLTSGDTIAVNTAALITIGDNSSVSTAFIGVAALGLPAVLTMGTGSTLDRCYGALFALSLDASAGGGTVDEVGLCKAVAIPNGSTTVTNLMGYLMDLPFGDPGTTSWGFYERPGVHNYLQGDLLIGGTAGSDDVVTNSSVALEIKSTTKAFVASRMTTTERNSLTAIDGMVLYNTTDSKLQVRAGGSWVDLH